MGTPVLSITADRLSRAEIFRTLSETDLIAIAEFCKEERGLENHAILEEGNPADTLFIVERGKLALEKKIQIGRHTTPRNATIGYVESGEIAGYSTLTEPHIYSTSAVCIENSRLIAIDGQKLREYLNTNPDERIYPNGPITNDFQIIFLRQFHNRIHIRTLTIQMDR